MIKPIRWAALLFAALLTLGAIADAQEAPPSAPDAVTLGALLDDPAAYEGRTVVIETTVAEWVNVRAFLVEDAQLLGTRRLLVLNADERTFDRNVAVGRTVRITATLQTFDNAFLQPIADTQAQDTTADTQRPADATPQPAPPVSGTADPAADAGTLADATFTPPADPGGGLDAASGAAMNQTPVAGDPVEAALRATATALGTPVAEPPTPTLGSTSLADQTPLTGRPAEGTGLQSTPFGANETPGVPDPAGSGAGMTGGAEASGSTPSMAGTPGMGVPAQQGTPMSTVPPEAQPPSEPVDEQSSIDTGVGNQDAAVLPEGQAATIGGQTSDLTRSTAVELPLRAFSDLYVLVVADARAVQVIETLEGVTAYGDSVLGQTVITQGTVIGRVGTNALLIQQQGIGNNVQAVVVFRGDQSLEGLFPDGMVVEVEGEVYTYQTFPLGTTAQPVPMNDLSNFANTPFLLASRITGR